MADDNGNPFDRPLDSEVQDHQQAQATRIQKSDNGNPFDEPLMSEKAEAQTQPTDAQLAYRKATAPGPFTQPGAAEKAMGQTIGDNKAQAVQGLKNVGQAALETGAGVVGASLLPEAGPIVAKATEYLGHLNKIAEAAKKLGWASFGLKEAHDLYEQFSGDKK